MKHLLMGALAILMALTTVGCEPGKQDPSKTSAEKQFEDIYKQYSARFHEKMVGEAETLQPAQVMAEASRIWEDVFGPHQNLLKKRAEEILASLDTAKPFDEDLYLEVASGTRVEPPADQPKGVILKQFLWSPIGAAQMGLNHYLARLLQPQSFGVRSVLTANAGLFWEALDRNIDRPKLVQRQGPMLYVVEVSRAPEGYYQVEQIRWLRPKSMGPMQLPEQAPAEGQPATGAPAVPPTTGTTPATGAPTPKAAPAETPEKPAEKPAAK